MQIIQFLFKACNTCGRSQKEKCTIVEEAKSTDHTSVCKRRGDGVEETEKMFTMLLKRDDSTACFYSALQLKRLDILRYDSQNCGLVEMGHKSETVAVGCKILPICDVATLGSADCREGLEKEAVKRRRAVARMKEVMRWAAAVKSSSIGGIKGWKVLYLRNKMALKDPIDDANSNSNSRKVSFGWDVGSCSTSSSVFSPISMPLRSRSDQMWSNNLSNQTATLQTADSNVSSLDSPKSECNRAAQWITTDSDFVVLEL